MLRIFTLLRRAASLPFFTRLRRASHLSLLGQRNMAQRKATPVQRSPGIRQLLLRGSTSCIHAVACLPTAQRDSGGSPTVHPWTDVELGAIHYAHPAGLSYVTLPLHRGPFYCASCVARAKQIAAHHRFALAFPSPASREKVPGGRRRGFGFGAQDARSTGSPRSRRGCGGSARRVAHTMWASSMPVHGWTVSEPRSRLAHLKHRDCAQGASVGWPSVWLLFSWPRKRK